MASFLPGGDILEFLACLGKTPTVVPGPVARGFQLPIFVEDTDPSFTKNATEDQEKCWNGAQTGWGADQREQSSGWDKHETAPRDDGWDTCKTETGPQNAPKKTTSETIQTGWTAEETEQPRGWGTCETSTNDNGWDICKTKTTSQDVSKQKTDETTQTGWDNDQMEQSMGWGTQESSFHDNGWGTCETETAARSVPKQRIGETEPLGWGNSNANVCDQNNDSETELLGWGDTQVIDNENTNERTAEIGQQNNEFCGSKQHFANMKRSRTFGPSGSNAIPLGKRRDFRHSDTSCRTEGSQEPFKKYPVRKVKMRGADADLLSKETWKERSTHGKENCRRKHIKELLASLKYPEVSELRNRCNKILHYSEYKNGDKLNVEDEKFVLEKVIVHHPERKEKLGSGVESVIIDMHPNHNATCFFLVRNDGSKADFSYWKCLEKMLESEFPGWDSDNKTPDEDSQKGDLDGNAWGETGKDSIHDDSDKIQGGEGW